MYGSPQGNLDPTQPAQPYPSSNNTTQYGSNTPYPPPPLFNPYQPPSNKPPWTKFGVAILLGIIVVLLGAIVLLLLRQGTPSPAPTATVVPSTQIPTVGSTTIVQTTQIPTSVATQPPVDPTKQGRAIPSSQTDPPYSTPNGTVICSGDVSVTEPNGTTQNPDSDPTTGEVVATTGKGYTITFTNSASCTQYPTLTKDQVNGILARLQAQQKSSGCVNNAGCTGTEQVWIFP